MKDTQITKIKAALEFAKNVEDLAFDLGRAVYTMKKYSELAKNMPSELLNLDIGFFSMDYGTDNLIRNLESCYKKTESFKEIINKLERQLADQTQIIDVSEVKPGVYVRSKQFFEVNRNIKNTQLHKFGMMCAVTKSAGNIIIAEKVGTRYVVLEKDNEGLLLGDTKYRLNKHLNIIYVTNEFFVDNFVLTGKIHEELYRIEFMIDEFENYSPTSVMLIDEDNNGVSSCARQLMQYEIIGQVLIAYFEKPIKEPKEVQVHDFHNNITLSFVKDKNYYKYNKEASELPNNRLPAKIFKSGTKRILNIMSTKKVESNSLQPFQNMI